jgi:metal-responsive CopG/Arc/MetJ family transcriptional regulator
MQLSKAIEAVVEKKMPKSISEPVSAPLGDLLEHFLSELGQVQAEMTSANLSVANPSANSVVQKQIVQLQQHFQQILKLIAEAVLQGVLQGEHEQRLRSYQTEAHRLLRLMGIAALKLRTAKQLETWEQQRSHIETLLAQLQPFAQAIASEVSSSTRIHNSLDHSP